MSSAYIVRINTSPVSFIKISDNTFNLYEKEVLDKILDINKKLLFPHFESIPDIVYHLSVNNVLDDLKYKSYGISFKDDIVWHGHIYLSPGIEERIIITI